MCLLRAGGEDFDPDTFIGSSTMEPCKVFRRGELRIPKSAPDGPRFETSGMNFVASDAAMSDLQAQVADAESFLVANHADVDRLAQCLGLTYLTLDFPIELRIVVAQFDRFPASLVRVAGALGIALELSIYPCSDD